MSTGERLLLATIASFIAAALIPAVNWGSERRRAWCATALAATTTLLAVLSHLTMPGSISIRLDLGLTPPLVVMTWIFAVVRIVRAHEKQKDPSVLPRRSDDRGKRNDRP